MDLDLIFNCSNKDMWDILMFSYLESKPQVERKVIFNLDDVSDEEAWQMFRFKKSGILQLKNVMEFPEYLYGSNRIKFTSIEGICILLRRLAYPNRLCDLAKIFGRSDSELSVIVNTTLNFIYRKYGQLLTNLDQNILSEEKIKEYCAAIEEKGAPLKNCWGFIDGTLRPCCRPSINQRELYSGHKRVHGIKFQGVVLPSGIIVHLYGPVAGRRHDCYLLTKSGILEEMETKMNSNDGNVYCIYGDGAYPVRAHLLASFKGANLTQAQTTFNRIMSKSRVSVEWEFGKMVSLFAFLDFKKNLKLYLQPIAKYYIVATILKNCHNCLYGSETSIYFNCQPPTLEEYLQ